jgi:hypothetical protein
MGQASLRLAYNSRFNDVSIMYEGATVDVRMNELRHYIAGLRSGPIVLHGHDLMDAKVVDSGRWYLNLWRIQDYFHARQAFLKVRSSNYSFLRSEHTGTSSALDLIETCAGYHYISNTINKATSEGRASSDDLKRAVFLLEVITIDLYHYYVATQRTFVGLAYQAKMMNAQLQAFVERVESEEEVNRHTGTPLSLHCASIRPDEALSALYSQSDSNKQKYLLYTIHVFSLNTFLLRLFQNAFPAAIVTTICAVQVIGSKHVILRGAFYSIAAITKEQFGKAMHLVMLNSNRDHLTNEATNIGEDLESRNLFRTLVTADRYVCCAQVLESISPDSSSASQASLRTEARRILVDLSQNRSDQDKDLIARYFISNNFPSPL